MNKEQRKSAQKRRKVYRELDETMAKGRKFLKKETDKKGNLSQRAKNLQQAIKSSRARGTVSTMMGKGGGDVADKLKTLKKGGMVIAPKSGSAHYKSKQSAKSIAKKYFKGGIN